jgi:hypothetical protein
MFANGREQSDRLSIGHPSCVSAFETDTRTVANGRVFSGGLGSGRGQAVSKKKLDRAKLDKVAPTAAITCTGNEEIENLQKCRQPVAMFVYSVWRNSPPMIISWAAGTPFFV